MPSIHVRDTASAPAIVTSSNLNHIYFFTDGTDDAQHDRTNDAPPTSLDISHTRPRAATPPTPLNPCAPEFNPSYKHPNSPPPTADVDGLPPFHQHVTDGVEVRMTSEKGWGFFACKNIKRGTLIIKEPPLVAIATDDPHDVWTPYCRLARKKTRVYDSLHSYAHPSLNFEAASRQNLIEYDDLIKGEDHVNALVAEHVRVMSIFAANHKLITPTGRAVFANVARLNHSCLPNVYARWNPTLQQLTVYAIRDIFAGEELLLGYIGGPAQFAISIVRQEELGSAYNFTCTCPACHDFTGVSDARRETIARLACGLHIYDTGEMITDPSVPGEMVTDPYVPAEMAMDPYVPADPISALRQAEDIISLLLQEGIFDTQLSDAYRRASAYALDLRDFEKALKHAHHEKDNERCCLGTIIFDLRQSGDAAECWLEEVYVVIMREKGLEAVSRYRTMWRGTKKWMRKKAIKAARKKAARAKDGVDSH